MSENIADLETKVNVKSIIRVIHNKENPFVQINRHALWDQNLSLKAVGLWARCLSRPDDWQFNMSELIDKCKEGKDSIYSAMNELIENNYVLKVDIKQKENGKFSGGMVHYIFFEFPATEEDKSKEIEKLKKSFRHPGFQDPGFQEAGNPPLLISINTKKQKEQKINTSLKVPEEPRGEIINSKVKKKKILEEFPEESKQTMEEMFALMKEAKPDCLIPQNTYPVLEQIDLMIRKDKRDPVKILKVFRWAIYDNFWSDKMFKSNPAKYLRDKFDQLDTKMNQKPESGKPKGFARCSSEERLAEYVKYSEENAI